MLKSNSTEKKHIEVVRYDRLESRYLTTGDFSALQEMNTEYAIETKTLIENVLNLGAVYEPDINSTLLITIPTIYTQIGAFDQSIIVGEQTIGISLDKYLGADYPLYQKYYHANQRTTMTREYITPDCLFFYLMSIYPMKNAENSSQQAKDMHTARLMYVTNQLVGREAFNTNGVKTVEKYMKRHDKLTLNALLIQ